MRHEIIPSARCFRRARRAFRRLVPALSLLSIAGFCQVTLSVKDFGAQGNRAALDTEAIQKALDEAGAKGGGRVVFPPGVYTIGTVHLRDRVELHLQKGAVIQGTTNLDAYKTWSGKDSRLPKRHHRHWAMFLGEGVKGIAFTGEGIIDGQDVYDPVGEEKMRGPHTILLGGCEGVRLQGITLRRSGNYAFLAYFTHQVSIEMVWFIGGWDGVHFRGAEGDWSRGLTIRECVFQTGDDAIAGCFQKDARIEKSSINSSCNGIRIIGPMENFSVEDCQFPGPGVEPHRTSGERRRTNMLAAIALQPGAWDRKMAGASDQLRFRNLTMEQVASAFHVVALEGCTFGRIEIEGVRAKGVYRSPLTIESWGEPTFESVRLRDVRLAFSGGGTAEDLARPVKQPGNDPRAMPLWGLFLRKTRQVSFQDCRFSLEAPDARPRRLDVEVGQVDDAGLAWEEPAAR